jgi:hypothetical protein
MMSGGAFILLKTGRLGRKSRNQAEIPLAILLKILRIGRFRKPNSLAKGGKDVQ